MRCLTIFATLCLLTLVSSKTKEEWKGRAIYQIITDRFSSDSGGSCNVTRYCGGSYNGIRRNLNYIAEMGFDAIWISPVLQNTVGSYHGYHMINLYKLNQNFGEEYELLLLLDACHKRNILVMVDIVANHVGPVGTDYSTITPFNKSQHYHNACNITDYNNQWMVENCRIHNLPDLKHEDSWVADWFVEWIEVFLKKYSFDGMRLDSMANVPKWFWDKFKEASGPIFQMGEVFNSNPNYIADYQRHADSVFNYPLYYSIEKAYKNNNMKELENYWLGARNKFPDPTVLGVFIENHDNPRFLNRIDDRNKYRNAVVLSLTWEGIPSFYYGGEQWFTGGQTPSNREALWNNMDETSKMYLMIATINKMRISTKIWTKPQVQRYADTSFYAFTRGDVLVCVVSAGGAERTITQHNFKEKQKLCNIFKPTDCVTVEYGRIKVSLFQEPKIYVVQP